MGMIALLQRVAEATVVVNTKNLADGRKEAREVARIGRGMLALIGVESGDGRASCRGCGMDVGLAHVPDEHDRMNLNLSQVGGGLLLVPQFTLAADTNTGNRPSFSHAAPPEDGKRMFDAFVDSARQRHAEVECGVFGADMQVGLVNDGPVTFWLQVRPGS
jgi:D-tyrosyl-tRNA(Tyr) deacylase